MSKWVIIGRPNCPWCDKAKDLMHRHDIEFTYLEATPENGLRDFIIHTGLLTVPQIYRDGERYGNYEETLIKLEAEKCK